MTPPNMVFGKACMSGVVHKVQHYECVHEPPLEQKVGQQGGWGGLSQDWIRIGQWVPPERLR